jgi:hypothetical protein
LGVRRTLAAILSAAFAGLGADGGLAAPVVAREDAAFRCDNGRTLRVLMLGNEAFVRTDDGAVRMLMRGQGAPSVYQSASERLSIAADGARWQHDSVQTRCRAEAAVPPPDGFLMEGQTLVHRPSGMRFPPVVAGFVRDAGTTFDLDGNYVVVRYLRRLGGSVMEGRVGLVNMGGMTASEHYAGYSSKVLADLGGGTRHKEGPVPVAGRRSPRTGYGGSFVSADGARGATLITLAFGHWGARLQGQWPAAEQREARSQLIRLAEALDWNPVLRANPQDTPAQ